VLDNNLTHPISSVHSSHPELGTLIMQMVLEAQVGTIS
jgi:hypothetical protein